MRNYGQSTLRNHIQKNAPVTLQSMEKLFGFSMKDFVAAVYGEPGAIRKLADMGRRGQVASDNLEKALEAAKLTIETTGDLNKGLSELAKQTQKSGVQIINSVYDASLAERKFANEGAEARHRQANAVSTETGRHLRQTQLIQIQGATADLMAVTKYQTDLQKEENKVLDAQDAADRAYDKAVNNLLWQQGSEANISRIPRPNYTGQNASGIGKLWQAFKNRVGI